MRLGGKEGVKDLVSLFGGQSNAGIGDGNQHLTVFSQLRLDMQLAARVSHRLNAIEHHIHQRLLQLHTIRHNRGETFGKIGADDNGIPLRLIVQHCDNLFYEFIYVNYIQLRRALLVDRADAIDNIGCTPGVFDHLQRSFPRLWHIRLFAVE